MFGRVSDAGPNHGRCEPWAGRARYEGDEGIICEDCGEACERVRLVPEFAFLGCDACYDGCMAMLAEEAAELLAIAPRASWPGGYGHHKHLRHLTSSLWRQPITGSSK